MNLNETWRLIGECIATHSGGSAALAGASNLTPPHVGMWHALFSDRPRPLLLPANNRRARQSGLHFFLPELWRKCYASVRLRAHDMLGERARLPLFTLPKSVIPTLADELALTEAPQLAFLIGTPGPYQKASILVMSMGGEPMAIVKLALGTGANSMIEEEAAWLRRLNSYAAIRDCVPQLINVGVTSNEHRYFTQSVVKGQPRGNAFGPMHANFLRLLGEVDLRVARFTDAPVCQALQADLARLTPMLNRERSALLHDALADCTARLATWSGPFVLGHGDFASWNIRAAHDHVCVFDWEYASAGTSPLFDAFHFHLIAPASSARPLTPRDMKHAIVTSRAFAQLSYPQFDWGMPIVGAHALCYLLHTLIFYGLSRGEFVESHPIVRSYSRLVEERVAWLD